MATTLAISIDLPPVGELETSGNGSSPTDAQMAEEEKARQKFLDAVSPFLASVPKRRPPGMSAGRSGLPDRKKSLGGQRRVCHYPQPSPTSGRGFPRPSTSFLA